MTGPAHNPGLARGRTMIFGAALLWSMAGILTRLVETDSWTLTFWRSSIGGLFLLAAVAVQGRGLLARFRALSPVGWFLGIWMGIETVCFILAFTHTTIAKALIIIAINPLLAAFAGWLVLRERIAGHTVLALVATFGGVAYMVWGQFGGGSGFGDLMALTVAGMFAVVIVTIRRFGDIDLLPAMVVAGATGALLVLPWAHPFSVSLADAGYLALFGCGEFGLSLVLFTAGARLVPTVEVALLGLVESALAPLWVWFAVGEEPGERALIGGAVVLIALLLYTLVDWRRARLVPPLP
ncbi:membrane protein [Hypericibacter adhaerens]|uniref:Membrane protein n=1 Tax=Hypericibacter adhaerens TaxID=2602016 RepID=A0A5J6N4I2_9PROT|nr:DMT family transporter [Hypericibacter adhaerens]QEX21816.1 membrane protein [Hypericibacter adhaerens]